MKYYSSTRKRSIEVKDMYIDHLLRVLVEDAEQGLLSNQLRRAMIEQYHDISEQVEIETVELLLERLNPEGPFRKALFEDYMARNRNQRAVLSNEKALNRLLFDLITHKGVA